MALWIGQDRERPLMIFLVANELRRLCERDHNDGKTTALKFGLHGHHLAEVILARQSGQVPEKNQQSVAVKMVSQNSGSAAQVTETQALEVDMVH
jgi:hypothetical protein